MRIIFIFLLLTPFFCLAQKHDKVKYHQHFVIKEWEDFRESGDTLIYTSPKIIRGTKGSRAKAFYIKHPEIVKYLPQQEVLLFLDFAQMSWPCPQVIAQRSKKKKAFSSIDFKNDICTFVQASD